MRKLFVATIFLTLTGLMSFKPKTVLHFIIPKGWPKPAYDFKKYPLTEAKIALGRALFYDPVLSRDSSIACVSCHLPATAFTHIDHPLSHGIEGRIGTRNSPSLANLAWSKSFMWDGAVASLEQQPMMPISNHTEMDENIEHVAAKLQASHKYRELFYHAFADSAVTAQRVLQSLTQFVLTMVSADSKYDKVQRGEDTFTIAEHNGYNLFKQQCAGCHTEPLFTNQQFENNGLTLDESLKDYGQMLITHNPADSLKFKVPTLRNIEYTYPYMHDGRFKNLGQVLNNYIRGLQHGPTLSPKLQNGIYLSNTEKAQLLAFLHTLNDNGFMSDLRFSEAKE